MWLAQNRSGYMYPRCVSTFVDTCETAMSTFQIVFFLDDVQHKTYRVNKFNTSLLLHKINSTRILYNSVEDLLQTNNS